ncbi:MAG: GNAT family N-acetyltransferase [Salinisphaera sp.]|jgi:hypothetical protein|nr:GNAT family N-acetyltransferase [Salinisphaera sp.]
MGSHVYKSAEHPDLLCRSETPLAPACRSNAMAAELARSEKLTDLSDGKQIFLLKADLDSDTMREIGRLRELTFRSVGEGTGACRDLDVYDPYYQHLVLWDPKWLCIAGSYRLGHGGRLIHERGIAALYTTSLFDFSPALESRLLNALELGRSFVAPAYWRSRALDQLWQGIGLYLQQHPELRYLFGPVSMSITIPREAREWIAAAHLYYFGASGLATSKRPFVVSADVVCLVKQACDGLDSPAGIGKLKQHLNTLGVTLPLLYRRYVGLVEPGGVQFLAFGDDPSFSGCVDGLAWLDIANLKPAKRARYMGNRSLVPPAGIRPRSMQVASRVIAGSAES